MRYAPLILILLAMVLLFAGPSRRGMQAAGSMVAVLAGLLLLTAAIAWLASRAG